MFNVRPGLSVEALEPLSSRVRVHAGAGVAAARAAARDRLGTTPGRLVLLGFLLLAGALCFGVITSLTERSRAHAAEAVQTQTEPLLVQAVNLYTALSDGNATATTTFLRGGLEPPARRAHYLADLQLASASLTALTRGVGASGETRAAVNAIAQQLPVYSGLVEAARANNRQGLPLGAAYLRRASALLENTILPAASHLYGAEAGRLSDNYGTGGALALLAVLVVTMVTGLALLVTQRYLMRISQRVLNVPMMLASAVLLALALWVLVGVISEQNALAAARRDSDSVEVLSASRVLLARAQSDQSLALVNRGSDETDPIDFNRSIAALAPPSGLIGEAQTLATATGTATSARQLSSQFASFRAAPTSAPAADRLNGNLQAQITMAQGDFATAAADATSSLWGLSFAIPVLTLVAGGLTLLGVRQRLEEYR